MMPPSNLGARASIATAWHWVGSTDRVDAVRRISILQHVAVVVGRAADQEVLRDLAPALLQPVDVGLEAAGCGHQLRERGWSRSPSGCAASRSGNSRSRYGASTTWAIVQKFDAQPLGGEVERVEHRPAAAQEEGVGAAEAERAAERRLETHALLAEPAEDRLRLGDQRGGRAARRCCPGDPQQVVPELIFACKVR